MKHLLPLLLITVCGFAAEPPTVKSKAAQKLLKHPEFKKAMEAAPEFTKAVLAELDQHAPVRIEFGPLGEKVVGEYHFKLENGDITKLVFLDTGIRERYLNDKKEQLADSLSAGPSQNKWSIVNDEIHVRASRRFTDIFKLNPDNSLAQIGYKRYDQRIIVPKEKWTNYKRIK